MSEAHVSTGDAPKEIWTVQVLRFVAAFAVVCVHSTFYTNERLAHDFPVLSQGSHGVRLFFVISGLVMILSSERLATQDKGWLAFAIRRIMRIVPLYWLILTFKVLALLMTSGLALHSHFDPIYALKSYFFIPAINIDGEIKPLHGVGWTLNFEMFFYLLFTIALLLRLPVVRSIAPVLILCAAAAPFRSDAWPVALQFYCDPVVIDFLAGMVIARQVQRGLTVSPVLATLLVTGGLLGLFLPIWPAAHLTLFQSLLVTAFSTATVVGAIPLEPKIGRHLPRWCIFLGAASYSLYLIHPIIAPASPVLFAKLGLALPTLAVLGSMIIAMTGGALLYVLVENPLSTILTKHLKASRLMRQLAKPSSQPS